MFDLITGKAQHAPRHQAVPIVISVVVHTALIGSVAIGTLMFVVAPVPAQQMMMAFVAAPLPPPPPPPAPAPPREQARAEKPPSAAGNAVPFEAPAEIEPEPAAL